MGVETRLAKALAHLGLCSRRDAEKLVKMGRVKVNGVKVTTMGSRVLSSDSIEVLPAAACIADVTGSNTGLGGVGGGEEYARKGSGVAGHEDVMPALTFSGSSGIRPSVGPPRIWLYHKPPGVITSHKDPQNRPTVFEAFKAKERGSVPSPWTRY